MFKLSVLLGIMHLILLFVRICKDFDFNNEESVAKFWLEIFFINQAALLVTFQTNMTFRIPECVDYINGILRMEKIFSGNILQS